MPMPRTEKVKFVKELPPKGSTGVGRSPKPWWEQLKAKPGVWAVIPLKVPGTSRASWLQDHQVQIARRGTVVYGRYVGNGKG